MRKAMAGALSAALVVVGVSLVVLPVEPAGAVTVSDEASFRAAFTNAAESQIDVTADITFTNCAAGEPTRVSTNALTIVGNGHTLRQTCANQNVLGLQGPLVMNGATITGGSTNIVGGGIRSFNDVVLQSTTVTGNSAVSDGGGVWAQSLTLNNSTVTGNSSPGNSGGIVSLASVTLAGSTVSGNTGAGIGAPGHSPNAVTLINSTVNGNTGIGISTSDQAVPVTLFSSTVSQNSSGIQAAGPVLLENSTVSANAGTGVGANTAAVLRSTVSGNKTGVGVFGDVSVVASTVSNNVPGFAVSSETAGGPTVRVVRSTLSGNGGGVRGFNVFLENSTLSGNGTSGGVFGEIVHVDYSTVVRNAGADSANLRAVQSIIIRGSVVALAQGGAPNCGTITGGTSKQFSVVDDPSCGGPAEPDPLLGLLVDNGGPTLTHLPQPGSPVINGIPLANCSVDVDQRGVSRPQGSACDIGSVEVEGAVGGPPEPSPAPPSEPPGPPAAPPASSAAGAAAAAVPFSGTPRFTG